MGTPLGFEPVAVDRAQSVDAVVEQLACRRAVSLERHALCRREQHEVSWVRVAPRLVLRGHTWQHTWQSTVARSGELRSSAGSGQTLLRPTSTTRDSQGFGAGGWRRAGSLQLEGDPGAASHIVCLGGKLDGLSAAWLRFHGEEGGLETYRALLIKRVI